MTLPFSEAAARNTQPIGDILERELPPRGTILEIGCGTGQHAVAFAQRFPHLLWQPTDRPGTLEPTQTRRELEGTPNLLEPLPFDLFDSRPPLDAADAIFSANVLHIAPEGATPHLFRHARTILSPGAPLLVYGPFRDLDRPLEPSNAAFDAHLRQRDPRMGLRLAQEVDAHASAHGFALQNDLAMPANNRMRIWRRLPA
ncbi:MAG: DUF938 domain-containing protein [Deltaproteobacteria bacterium]|nr:MAG: DUF938 domain-containing protein [Deltaproteobacteria bacterium]